MLGEMDGKRALTVTEIVAATGFYDYEAKYGEGGSRHVLPAPIPPAIFERCHAPGRAGARRAWLPRRYPIATSVMTMLRTILVLLEVNTQPGMTPTSLVPEQAAHLGMEFDDLVQWIVEDASCPRECGGVR